MDSSIQIEEQAGQWLARRESGAWTGPDEAEFQAWLAQSTAHVVAYARLEAAWKQALRLKALSAGVPPGEVPSPEAWRLTPFFDRPAPPAGESITSSVSGDIPSPPQAGERARVRGPLFRRAIAASLILALATTAFWHLRSTAPDYQTPVGRITSVPMNDGSQVTLNTDSRIRVALDPSERRVELQQGEAFFEVAKDPGRPFVVVAGDKRVIAVGTAFSVRRDRDGIRVAVTEGRIRIEDRTQTAAHHDASDPPLTLPAGSVARATGGGVLVQEKPIAEIESDLSWRTGYLVFRNLPLAEAAAEFNRYNTRKIVIGDPAVGAIRVSGKFRPGQVDAFARLMEEGFPIQARRSNARIVLTDRGRAEDTAPAAR